MSDHVHAGLQAALLCRTFAGTENPLALKFSFSVLQNGMANTLSGDLQISF
jgi:hypothetical protein